MGNYYYPTVSKQNSLAVSKTNSPLVVSDGDGRTLIIEGDLHLHQHHTHNHTHNHTVTTNDDAIDLLLYRFYLIFVTLFFGFGGYFISLVDLAGFQIMILVLCGTIAVPGFFMLLASVFGAKF